MFLRKIMVLVSVCIIVTLSCTTYAEYEECLIGTSAKDFFELINHKIENPESVFYQAICTGYFICGNDSLYGIIGNNCEYYITFLVSNIDEEPIVLSGEALFKRETSVDSAISYDSVKKNAEDVSREIYYYSNEVTRGESAYGYPLCIEQYCSSKYMRYSYVFFDPQQHKQSRVDGAGYNNQSVIHTILPESIGKLVEITNALSSDEQLDSTFTRSDLVEVNNPLINPDEKEYKLAYNNHISLLFLCDKNETVKQVLIGSTEMGYRELFYDYIDIFYRIAGINKPEEMAYYLAALYGDSFTWENMIRHIVSYNGLRIKCSSFIIDGWAIDFTYDLSGIPQMMIYKGTLISRSFPYYSN